MRGFGLRGTVWMVSLAAVFLLTPWATAQVNYDKGRRTINGLVLLQDANDGKQFYYLPPYPRLAPRDGGGFEFLAVKFVDPEGDVNGGLLHFLIQFDLPDEEMAPLEAALQKQVPGGKIMGPVPMFEAKGKGKEAASTAFKVVSAVLSEGQEGMTRKLIASGHAPLTPGSKSAVAAILDQHGTTLLWDTLDGQTSDISIALHANYEAVVEGYNARIHADIDTVYKHFSAVVNRQSGFKKRELRNIVDKMMRDAVIKVDVFDRSEGLGIDVAGMRRLTDLCTDKLVELIFNHESGLTKLPQREEAIEKGQIQRRQERGWLEKLFVGTGNQEYVSDDQYVLKSRKDISQSVFSIVLSGRSTIKIPFDTSGNIRGFYTTHKEDPEMFRIVNLADPSFQKREIHFTVDREYVQAFKENINFVSVSFRKRHEGRPDTTREIQFTHQDVIEGKVHKFVSYPRLGQADSGWLDYEYRISWSIYGRDAVRVPEAADQWLEAKDAVVNLLPPFDKTDLELDADCGEFEPNNVHAGVVEVRYDLLGENRSERLTLFRAKDSETLRAFTLYHDKGKPPELRVTWHGKHGLGRVQDDWTPIDDRFIYLTPPEFKKKDAERGVEDTEDEPVGQGSTQEEG